MNEMTLQEFSTINGMNRLKGGGYEEMLVMNSDGELLLSWVDEDPKYQAKITRIHPIDDFRVEITIDYKGE